MKKYLFGALALPLLFACSSEDFDEKVVSNDKFAGIAKVDATFSMDEGATTRMANEWEVEYGDMFGFAWLGGGEATALTIDGNAWQNHPLTVVNDPSRGKIFKPETSIYVGKYFLYYPYDYDTKNIGAINFKSLVQQPLADGANETWKSVAKNAILIGDKWTEVKAAGTTISGKTWDKAGIGQPFNIYSAFFSNQTALDLTYVKNNPTFAAAKRVQGATDIDQTYTAGTEVGSADIFGVTVELAGQAKEFTYAPTTEPMADAGATAHSGTFWENKKNLSATFTGFAFTAGAVTLKAADADGVSTGKNGNKGWFWFNSLPVTAGNATSATIPTVVLNTSYGVVTINDQDLAACAYAYEKPSATAAATWIKLAAADDPSADPIEWDPAGHNTFVNQYGNHKGKYALDVDFSAGVMNNMHITSDAHLQKLLKYYIASGKNEVVTLNLDQAGTGANNVFKISKLSIALLQTINASGIKVLVQACGTHGTPKIIVTQDGSDGKTEVPDLDNVFKTATDVYLASGTNWTWKERPAIANYVTVDANVKSLTNEGTLTVNASNIQLSSAAPITNANGATMNITKVTTVKNTLTNLGEINVPAGAELRAFAIEIRNEATALGVGGTINNGGVIGVTAGTTPAGQFNNYSYIEMTENNAITLLTSNQVTGNFGAQWATGNKMGTVKLPNANATALVSVANATDQGFIKYEWPATSGAYSTPAGNVKYNTIVVNGENGDISFTTPETEIQFIEFNGTRTQVINPTNANLPNLKGIYVNAGKSIILEKTNTIDCAQGAYLGSGATVYRGGLFTKAGAAFAASDATAANNYFGGWDIHQIVEY